MPNSVLGDGDKDGNTRTKVREFINFNLCRKLSAKHMNTHVLFQ
jgi:hypothetical protein